MIVTKRWTVPLMKDRCLYFKCEDMSNYRGQRELFIGGFRQQGGAKNTNDIPEVPKLFFNK
jgi:hypothetical protein